MYQQQRHRFSLHLTLHFFNSFIALCGAIKGVSSSARRVGRGLSLAALLFSAMPVLAQLTYDADTNTNGAQDGSGLGWNTTNLNWWNNAADVVWPNTNTSVATFGAGSGAAGSVTVGTVTANGIIFNAAGSGSYTLTGGTINLAGTTPTLTANVNAQIDSILTGSAGFTKTGTGTLTLNGTNTVSGTVAITQGTLVARINGTQSALGGSLTTVNVASGATLLYNHAATTTTEIAATHTGSGTINVQFSNNNAIRSTRFTNGGGGSTIDGFTGQIILSVVPGGTTGEKLVSSAGLLITTAASLVINSGTQLQVSGGGADTTVFSGGITVSGTGNIENRGAIRLQRTLQANLTLAGNTTIGTEGGTLNGTITGTATTGNVQTLTLGTDNSTGSGIFSGVISDGSALGKVALVKTQTGTVTLSAVNTFTGGITVNAGTLTLTGGGLPGATSVNGSGGGAILVNAGGTLVAGAEYTLGYARAVTLDGGVLSITMNNYSNNITLSNGALISASGNFFRIGFQSNASITVTGTSASSITANVRMATNGLVNPSVNLATFNVADVTSSAAADLTISGVVQDVGTANAGMTLLKTGAGNLVLTNANTFAGATTVSAGTLSLVGAAASTGAGAVTVQSTATLQGTGIVRGASFTAQMGSTIHAGDTPAQSSYGTLTFTPGTGSGTIAFEGGSTVILGINLAGASDKIVINGTGTSVFQFNANLTVGPSAFTPVTTQVFDLLDWSGLAGTPTFASRFTYTGLLLGNGDEASGLDLSDISGSGYAWDISSFTTNGSIAIVLVPEPGRAVLLLTGLWCIATRRRRSRQPEPTVAG